MKKGKQATRFSTQAADVICTLPVALPILRNAVNCDLLYLSALDSKGLHPLLQCHCSHPNFIPMFVSSIKRKVYSKERLEGSSKTNVKVQTSCRRSGTFMGTPGRLRTSKQNEGKEHMIQIFTDGSKNEHGVLSGIAMYTQNKLNHKMKHKLHRQMLK